MDMEIVNRTVDVLNHYPGPVLIATCIITSGVMAWTVLRWKEHQDKQRADNDMKRRAVLDQMYADAFGDVLFQKLHDGVITRHEYRRDCKRFGIAYRLGDLLTRKNPKRGMRYRIIRNCQDIHHTPSTVGKIPGDRPIQNPRNDIPVVAVVTQRKVWVARGKLRERTT
jgi:hypothetical protein